MQKGFSTRSSSTRLTRLKKESRHHAILGGFITELISGPHSAGLLA
jgi:hypothetical protein